ncbi:CLPTM1-like membrane protein cnrB [Histomonas meleagridis]|uniref:CLPTM1-like membrane protein cnrB n=1 Tax=Histomonas meleagridis TaxID=135588 RepID=UPI00355977D5|nr:CLPTM1-like membrane protein cnrB [Histomonas meleagridis]KAH0800813.1 CLPTM1-like membrane protein cnrB [Histomonas meleagridis]
MRDKRYDCKNILKFNESLSMALYIGIDKNKTGTVRSIGDPIWSQKEVFYRKKKYFLNQTFRIPITEDISQNTSDVYLIFTAKQNNCEPQKCIQLRTNSKVIHWYIPKPDTRHKLLESSTPTPIPKPVPFIFRTSRFDLVVETEDYNTQAMMPMIAPHVRFNRARHTFSPAFKPDTFFDIPTERRRLNLTSSDFPINVQLNLRGRFVWYIKEYVTFIESMNEFIKDQFDEMKRIFIETNPALLWTTGIASFLKFIFQVLAFERDLEFWQRKESLRGVSLSTIVIQFIGQLILFLNLLESNRIPLYIKAIDFANLIMQVWKIFRLAKLSRRFPFFKVRREYRGETNEADSAGMRILYILLTPLVIGYSIYQLRHGKFRSFRTYIIHCASGAVYSFGFLMMLPQLYVNYKLKTVAGMSKSALVYKFISTFIDDLYTFVSKMPLMYKIACFRDDVVFVVWVIQCCIYPVDPTRPNEYGLLEKNPQEKEEKEEKNEKNDNDNNNKVKTD